jgi:hypothetical protein
VQSFAQSDSGAEELDSDGDKAPRKPEESLDKLQRTSS